MSNVAKIGPPSERTDEVYSLWSLHPRRPSNSYRRPLRSSEGGRPEISHAQPAGRRWWTRCRLLGCVATVSSRIFSADSRDCSLLIRRCSSAMRTCSLRSRCSSAFIRSVSFSTRVFSDVYRICSSCSRCCSAASICFSFFSILSIATKAPSAASTGFRAYSSSVMSDSG